MSDREGRAGPSDDELSLPRATVAKMIQGTGHLHHPHLIFHFTLSLHFPFDEFPSCTTLYEIALS